MVENPAHKQDLLGNSNSSVKAYKWEFEAFMGKHGIRIEETRDLLRVIHLL